MRWLLAITLLLTGCSRVTSALPGSAPAVTTPDLSDAERIALARGRTAACRFVHGFAEARSAVPDVIGECVENERSDPASGDTLQRTTRGLLVWRKADGLVAFTDGHRTWVRGPDGSVRVRGNDERFAWEAAPAGAPAMRVVTPGPPVPTAAPVAGTPQPGSTPPAGTPSPGATAPAGAATKPALLIPAGPTKPSSEPPKPLPIGTAPAAKP